MTVHEIASAMRNYMDLRDIDLVNLIHVASKAEKNKTALIKARYHMFVRALEGAFITLNPNKKLFLTRQNYAEIDGESWKVFEAAVCDDCGRIGVAGKTINDRLESAANRYDEAMEVYLLRSQGEELDLEEDDDAEDESGIGKEDYVLCAKCGEIHHESQKVEFSCGHGASSLIRVRRAERKGVRNENKCPCCNLGHMKLFYIGYDVATAVLGTELFEQLPESEEVLETKKAPAVAANNLFAMAAAPKTTVDIIKKKRQFLTFSDSRSEAAFYACYMTSFYEEFLRRRGIWHEALLDGNHYARLYSEKLMSPLHIKEHTAQLGRAEQQKYQEMFVNKAINALSCSTTFEMGVDVGDLETVYLRNMPPSPANYVQRAGRAGRSIHSAAYSLTYSKLSSHDFTYFEHPERMISGKIGVC